MTTQPFQFPFFQETGAASFERLSPSPRTYVRGTDFSVMEYSGSGDVTGNIVPTNDVVIPPGATAGTSNSGCEATDFPTSTTGSVALIQRGTCDFVVKARNAQAAGATAAIIFNEGQEGRTDIINGTLGSPDVTIPVLDTTFAVGEELYTLAQSGPVSVHIVTQTISETRSTTNVIANTPTGRTDRVVVVGAHLDSARPTRGSTTTAPVCHRTWKSRCKWPSSASSRSTRCALLSGVLRSRALGLAALRREPQREAAQGHRAEPELRHGRFPKLRPLRLRR